MERASLLRQTMARALPQLQALSENQAAAPSGPGKWSPKEEMGHLIDSASNNHLRFMGGATQPEFRGPGYAQQDWVRLHGYRDMPWQELVEFWHRYNTLLVRLISSIPEDRAAVPCTVGDGPAVTLGFLIEDYVKHMDHHLDHILAR